MLTIRDPRAAALAKALAKARQTTMTQAVVTALENELRGDRQAAPLARRLRALQLKAQAMASPNAREITREEIDGLSGV
jgi:antitoxin VapB